MENLGETQDFPIPNNSLLSQTFPSIIINVYRVKGKGYKDRFIGDKISI